MSKFNYIKRFSESNQSSFTIPDTFDPTKVNDKFFEKSEHQSYILRSALKNEGEKLLRSGESLSFKNIQSYKEFKIALDKINHQDELQSCILQKQIDECLHVTGICYETHIFLEIRAKDNSITFCMLSNGFQVGEFQHWKVLEEAVKDFVELPYMTFEMGIKKEGLPFLYQLTEIREEMCELLLSGGAFKDHFLNIKKLQKPLNLLGMISLVLKSKLMRVSILEKKLFSSVKNWNCILLYFSLYKHSMKKSNLSIGDFYSWLNIADNWITDAALAHIILANRYSHTLNLHTFDNIVQQVFIGSGIVRDKPIFMNKLLPEEIKNLPSKSLIFTLDYSLFGHGYLSAVEYGHAVVGGLTRDELENYSLMGKISVDFKQNKIMVS